MSPGPACGHIDQRQESRARTHIYTHYPSGDEAGVHGRVWRQRVTGSPAALAHSGRLPPLSPSSSPIIPETAGLEMLQLDSASMDIVGQCFHVHCSVSLGHLEKQCDQRKGRFPAGVTCADPSFAPPAPNLQRPGWRSFLWEAPGGAPHDQRPGDRLPHRGVCDDAAGVRDAGGGNAWVQLSSP